MPTAPCLLAIDQGTTSSRAMVFHKNGQALAVAQKEFPQYYPHEGWVEHDPETIWQTTLETARECAQKYPDITGIGITNQRETTILWERATGRPIYPAIVWQDRRTAEYCATLKAHGKESAVTEKTGLVLDPYFSATKIAWILDHVEEAREKAARGELAFGTVDSFLLWRLTGGNVHATDATNASRTLLFNIHTQRWDEELLQLFDIPQSILPEVKDSASDFGSTAPGIFEKTYPITAIAGDQQAAAFGQCCFTKGMMKSTYGTGCFVLLNTGNQAVISQNKLLTTIAYRLSGKTTYALEGSIFIAGAAIQWLRDKLHCITHAKEAEALAESVRSNHGVYLVPAFTGLGAPYWEPDVRGALFGLTRDTGQADITRAALEAVAYQTYDLLSAMKADGINTAALRVDGGMVANNWLIQFLSDILDLTVTRPVIHETTALGVAYLAGLQSGVYQSLDEITSYWQKDREFTSAMPSTQRHALLDGWQRAVQATRQY